MPSITDLTTIRKTNKLFKKKAYRPWGDDDKKNSEPDSPEITKSKNIDVVLLKDQQNKVTVTPDSYPIDMELEKIWRCLYGAKKTLLNIILQNIEEIHDTYVITSAITTQQLMLRSSMLANTIKTSLQQLKQDSLIFNHETKPGKGGFARYKISKNVYEYFIEKFLSDT